MRLALSVLLFAGCNSIDPASEGGAVDGSTLTAGDGGTASSCGVRGDMRGFTKRMLTVAGLDRTYLVYLPASADPHRPLPLVFVFHGYTMSGQQMATITRYAALADAEGIAVVFPDGEGGPVSFGSPWNVKDPGQRVCGAGDGASATGDDLAFIDAMKADVASDQCLDTAHEFAVGFSMGAYFTEHLACYRPDIRAVAPHSGGALPDFSSCTTGHVPIILFHGTSDALIDDACDDPTATPVSGYTAAATLWAQKNGCASTNTTVDASGAGGGMGRCLVYDGCPADGQVELCLFDKMPHCWAGGDATGANGNACPAFADATGLQWGFFKKYAW